MKTGFYSMTNEDYHDGEGLSKSDLTLFAKTPAHYQAREQFEETSYMAFGEAIHTAILEPARFAQDYVVAYEGFNMSTNKAKAFAADAEERGKIIIRHDNYEDIRGMVKSINAHSTAKALVMEEGPVEASGFWTDPRTGLLCKCRPDKLILGDRIMVDLKSTEDASYEAFSKRIATYKYHWQGSHYLTGVSAITEEIWRNFVIIAIEKKPPYAVAVYRLNDEMIYLGGEELKVLMDEFRECLEQDRWPAYPDEVQTIVLPQYYYKKAYIS